MDQCFLGCRSPLVQIIWIYSRRPQAWPLLDALYWVGPVPYLELLRPNQSFYFMGWDQFHTKNFQGGTRKKKTPYSSKSPDFDPSSSHSALSLLAAGALKAFSLRHCWKNMKNFYIKKYNSFPPFIHSNITEIWRSRDRRLKIQYKVHFSVLPNFPS